METEVNCHSEPLGEESSFRAVGEESKVRFVRDISLSFNRCHSVLRYGICECWLFYIGIYTTQTLH